MMFFTLLLPVIVPYGCPVTFFDPRAHNNRKAEFFMWATSVREESQQYQQVPLLLSEEVEKHSATFIEGQQKMQSKFVPSSVS